MRCTIARTGAWRQRRLGAQPQLTLRLSGSLLHRNPMTRASGSFGWLEMTRLTGLSHWMHGFSVIPLRSNNNAHFSHSSSHAATGVAEVTCTENGTKHRVCK
jgi:hypothetical protein